MIDKMDKWIIIIIAIGNFIIAFSNYFQAISSHDTYYISLGIFSSCNWLWIMYVVKKRLKPIDK